MTPLSSPPVLEARPVQLRLIQRASAGTVVVGATFAAQAPLGVNGRQGYQSGRYEAPLSEMGEATVTFPNGAGADGKLHRTRFECLTDSRYNIGDEWIEVWHGTAGRGRLLFVGSPADWSVSRASITLTLVDATGPLELQREFAAGFWRHAPRDVFEHYTKAWRTLVADDFIGGRDAAKWSGSGVSNLASAVRIQPVGAGSLGGISALSAAWEGVQPNLLSPTERAWRVEMTYDRNILAGDVAYLRMLGSDFSSVQVHMGGTHARLALYGPSLTLIDDLRVLQTYDLVKKGASLALECRDKWVLAYVDGALVASMELNTLTLGVTYLPDVNLQLGTPAGGYIDVDRVILRKASPYLIRGATVGDYRLPGVLPSGGLRATYYDDADIRSTAGSVTNYHRRVLAPTKKPYARRQEAQVNYAVATPPAWQAVGPPTGEYFSVVWTGAVYLDLAASDRFLRLENIDNSARLWVGPTTYSRTLCSVWASGSPPQTATSGSLRTHTGGSLSGWYPLRLEFAQMASGAGLQLQWATTSGGTYTAIPADMLSPYGIFESDVRYDSHAEGLKAVVSTFGLQYRCEARSLESGAFPGEVLPMVRVGRDTDKVLTPSESTEVELQGSARETVQTMLADAAGLADPANAAQLTAESIDFASVFPSAIVDRHLMTTSAYESLADITSPEMLATRLAAMLGLRLAPWEEIGARPRGSSELRDTFPLSGSLALFAWEPGDGIRIVDPALGFEDVAPRQIVAPSWPFGPDALGAPSARFRQRPRSQQDALRELVRAVLLPQRNYQGQLAAVLSGVSNAGSGTATVPLPANLSDVVAADLIVTLKSDASTWTIVRSGDGATMITVNSTGHYNVLPWLNRYDPGGGASGTSQVWAVTRTGGTGTLDFYIQLLVRV